MAQRRIFLTAAIISALCLIHASSATISNNSNDSNNCETLVSAKLTYPQHSAPRDISDVLRVVVEKINRELSGVTNVKITWGGKDIHRRVGHHHVQTMVERRLADDTLKESCFVIPVEILDTDECTLPKGHEWYHKCSSTATCINTLGSYECLCSLLNSSRQAKVRKELIEWQKAEVAAMQEADAPSADPDIWNEARMKLDSKWRLIVGDSSTRLSWELSVPSVSVSPSSSCGGHASTKFCCESDAHSLKPGEGGSACRNEFICPIDPCANINTSATKPPPVNRLHTNQCVPQAKCHRAQHPWENPSYTCLCPQGYLGNGKYCPLNREGTPMSTKYNVIKVKSDGITPVQSTLPSDHHQYIDVASLCGCTPTEIDPCADTVCPLKNQICTLPDANSKPVCVCKPGYVEHAEYGCIDKTPPKLQLKCDPNKSGISIYHQGDQYRECAVDIVDENAEDYYRSLQIDYNRMYQPLGHCLTDVGTYSVKYTVATPWTTPSSVNVIRTVQVKDVDECAIAASKSKLSLYSIERKCPQVIPHCDFVHGAVCLNTDGSYTCQCPKYTTGDGFLPIRDYSIDEGKFKAPHGYKGGTGCTDTTKPVIELKGVNPKVFRVPKCTTLKGVLSPLDDDGRGAGDATVMQKAKQIADEAQTMLRSYYANQISYMIESTKGAELCAREGARGGQVSSPTECVYAFDQTYNETVDLSAKVVLGDLVPVDTNRWRVPYNVMDVAGNAAETVYRDVIVEEVALEDIKSLSNRDMEEAHAREVAELKQALDSTSKQLQETKSRVVASPNNKRCPPCPACEASTCPSTSTPCNCENFSQQTCVARPSVPTENIINGFFVMIEKMDDSLAAILSIIFICIVAVIILFAASLFWSMCNRIGRSSQTYYIDDDDDELDMQQNVTYYKSPSPLRSNLRPESNRTPTNGMGSPPPRSSRLFSPPNGTNVFETQRSQNAFATGMRQ